MKKAFLWGAIGTVGLFAVAVGGGAYVYLSNAPSNVTITLERINLSTQRLTGGRDMPSLLVQGLAMALVVDATFDIDNGNMIGATVESVDYHLKLNGKDIGQGQAPTGGPLSVSGNSHAKLSSRTQVPAASLLGASVQGLSQGGIRLEVEGTARWSVLWFQMDKKFRLAPSHMDGTRLDTLLNPQ